jgi:KipI family sensor histidine kinase inhibitor
MTAIRYLDAGECALVVECGSTIDDALIAQVLALDAAVTAAVTAAGIAGVLELVPTYRSLMVHYDPRILHRDALVALIAPLARASVAPGASPPAITGRGRLWRLPACYDPAFAPDMAHVTAVTGLAADEVIQRHATAIYRLAMYGFAPGWAYLSGLPAALALPRRIAPRDSIPAGSLIIAGGQAIVAGSAMPSGWHLIGRTPERLFHPARTQAFTLAVGDRLTFAPIDLQMIAPLEARAAAGEVLAECLEDGT